MNCYAIDNIWDYYCDKRLLPSLEARIKAHVDACPRCLRQAQAQLVFQNLIQGERAAPAGLKLPESAMLQEESISIREWFEGFTGEFAPAYAIALIYLAATPVLKSLSLRFY